VSGEWWIYAQLLDVIKKSFQVVMARIGFDDSFADDSLNTFFKHLRERTLYGWRLCQSTSFRGKRSRRRSSRSPAQP
jgi:hypothetical protein